LLLSLLLKMSTQRSQLKKFLRSKRKMLNQVRIQVWRNQNNSKSLKHRCLHRSRKIEIWSEKWTMLQPWETLLRQQTNSTIKFFVEMIWSSWSWRRTSSKRKSKQSWTLLAFLYQLILKQKCNKRIK
jgi:hypothetical protein